jgi:uncharacterized membrane protein YadS
MIAPIVLASIFFLNRFENKENRLESKISVPLFSIIFLINSLICAGLNEFTVYNPILQENWIWVQTILKSSIIPFLLAISFAGVGSKVKIHDILKVGVKPFIFAAIMSTVAGTLALIMAALVAPFII